jgi:hypothetical protein
MKVILPIDWQRAKATSPIRLTSSLRECRGLKEYNASAVKIN